MNQSDPKRGDERGVLAVTVNSLMEATEKTVHAGFGIVRDVRGEFTQRVTAIIDWVDGVQQGTIRIARSVVQRTDDVAGAWIDANQQLALGVVHAVRATGEGATLFASRTAASLTSTRRDRDGSSLAQQPS